MFESFFEWSDEQGLPFRAWADALQEKGIPPAALLLVPLLLIGVAAFFFVNSGPATGSILVSASTAGGDPLAGVSVSLTTTHDFSAKKTTDSSGRVVFDSVPAGVVHAVASSQSGVLDDPNFDLTVVAGKQANKKLLLTLQEAQGVNLFVDVANVDFATVILLDAEGNVKDQVADTTSTSFSLSPNTRYVVRATGEGLIPDEKTVTMDTTNQFVTLVPGHKGSATSARLHVRVVAAGVAGTPVQNASVKVFQDDAPIASAVSSADGSVPALSVPYNASLLVTVFADGFLEGQKNVTVSNLEQVLVVALVSQGPVFSGVRLNVQDMAGNVIHSPLVRLYQKGILLRELLPEDGIALFNTTWSSALGASVYKPGFLPKFLPSIQKDQLVQLAISENVSAQVRVHVTDWKGQDAPRVSVSLWDSKGNPLGIPARLSDSDGVQVFGDVPVQPLVVRASDGVRAVSSGVLTPAVPSAEQNATNVELQFAPAQVVVPITVVDHFSRAPILGAEISGGNGSCTTKSEGRCAFAVLESDRALFHVSAADYQSLDSAQLSVFPGMAPLVFELTADAVARNVRLRFDGLFDVAGRKVSALTPLTEYEARYVMVGPPVGFGKAEAQIALRGNGVFLGAQSPGARVTKGSASESGGPSQSASLDVGPVTLTSEGFLQPSFEVVQGGSVVFINEDNVTHFLAFDDGQSVTIPTGQNRSVVFNKIGGFPFKSLRNPAFSGFATVIAKVALDASTIATDVLLEYGPFNGSRQIAVRLRSGQKGELSLEHRSAFYTPTETLRSPPDGLETGARFRIDFAGTCTDSLCVQYYFVDASAHKVDKLQLPWGQTASLVVNVFGLTQAAGISIGAGPALTLLSGKTNSSTAIVSASTALVSADTGQTSAEFSFKGVRLAQDATLHINVTSAQGALYDADAFVVVYSQSTPSLFVTVKPDKLTALSSSKVTFVVKNFLGQPVDGARITLGEQEATAMDNRSGVYVVEDVNPESLSPIPFQVSVEGFRPFSGSLSVQAPDSAIDLTPSVLALSVDAKSPASTSVQLSNKLADKLRVSISSNIDSGGDLTDVSTSAASLILSGKGSGSFDLKAAIKENVLEIAKKAGTLKDHVQGNVHVRFSGKGFSDTRDIPFSVDATFSQSGIDDAWTITPDSVLFNLEPPQKKADSIELAIANNAPYPLVFNLEQTLGLSVQPASLTLAAGGSGSFTLKASVPREVDCFSEDFHKQGALTVYGTFQGLSSKKTAQVSLDVSTTKLSCQPPNGLRVTLPIDARMTFFANARTKTNTDGSTTVLLPSQELVWFASGVSVTPIDASVPQGTAFILERNRVQPLPQGGWLIAFPVSVQLTIPAEADRQPYGNGQTIVTLDNAQIILPAGVQAQTPQTGSVRYASAPVVIPPMSPVVFQPISFNYNALQELLPPDPIEVKLPADATLDLLPGTVERKNVQPKTSNVNPINFLPKPAADANLQNIKAIQLPNGERMAFGDAAAILIDKGQLQVPAGTSVYVSRTRVNAVKGLSLSDAFELRLPVSYALSVSGSPKAFKTQEGKNALKIADEAVVQATWSLSVSKAAGTSASVLRVAHENALTFLKGAFSRIPYNPAGLAKCAFDFNPPKDVSFSLPKGSVVQKTANGFEAILPECDDTARVVFSLTSSSTGSSEIFQSPAIKKLTFSSDSEFVVGDLNDAEEKSIRTSSPLHYTACLKDAAGKDIADGLREAKVTFGEKSLVALPERALLGLKENAQDVDLGALTPVSFASGSSPLGGMGSTKALKLVSGSGKIMRATPPDYPASGLLMPQGSAIAFVPVCEKGTGRITVSATADDLLVALDKDGKTGRLDVTFSNKNPDQFKQSKDICIFNNGKQSVVLDHVDSQPDSALRQDHALFFKAIASPTPERAYFSQPSVYGNRQKIAVEASVEGKDNCRKFTLEFQLPEDLVHKGKCIKQGKVPDSMPGSYTFKFNDLNGDLLSSSDKQVLPITLHFDQNPAECQVAQEEKQFADLTGISVNFDQEELKGIGIPSDNEGLFFKDAGHERFISLVNNEDKPITVTEISGTGTRLMSCALLDERQQRSTTLLQVGKRVEPAEVLVLSCLSNPGSQDQSGDYKIAFQGESYVLSKTMRVHVWNPGPMRALYPFTPMGKTLPFYDPAQSTPKQRQAVQTAGYQSLAFADAAPATASSGTAPVASGSTNTNAPVDVVSSPDASVPNTPSASATEAQAKLRAQNNQVAYKNLLNFQLCKKYFCNQKQAGDAILSFAKTFSELVELRLRNGGPAVELEGINALCRTLQGGAYFQKSILVQLTNVQLAQDTSRSLASSLQQEARASFSDMNTVVVKASDSGSVLFDGCGLYRVTARLDPACAIGGSSAPEWKKNMNVELSVAKLKSCPVNLANAALLTAENPFAYAGNEQGKGVLNAIRQVFSVKTIKAVSALPGTIFASNDKDKIQHVFENVGRLRQGVLGAYGSEPNGQDQQTAKALFSSLYGANTNDKSVKLCPVAKGFESTACPARYYEDQAFCWRTGAPVLRTMVAVTGAEALANAIIAGALSPATSGLSFVKVLSTNYRLIATYSGCVAAGGAEYFQGRSALSCRALDMCTSSLLAGSIEMFPFVPFNFGVAAGQRLAIAQATTTSAVTSATGSAILQSAIGAGIITATDALIGGDEPEHYPVTPITIVLGRAVSPTNVERGAVFAKRISVNLLPDSSPTKQVEQIVQSMRANGLYGTYGMATAGQVARTLVAARSGSPDGNAFSNAIVRGMSQLSAQDAHNLQGHLGDVDYTIEHLATDLATHDAAYAQQQAVASLHLGQAQAGSYPDLQAYFNALSPGVQDAVFAKDEIKAYKFRIPSHSEYLERTIQEAGRPDRIIRQQVAVPAHDVTYREALAYQRNAVQGAPAVDPNPLEIFRAGNEHVGAAPKIAKILEEDPDIFRLYVQDLTHGVQAYQRGVLNRQLAGLTTATAAERSQFIQAINARIPDAAHHLDPALLHTADDISSAITDRLAGNHLSFTALSEVIPGLPPGFAGLRGVLQTQLNHLPGTNPQARLRQAFTLQQMYDRNGNLHPITAQFIQDSQSAQSQAEARAGVRRAVAAEERGSRIARTSTAFAAFASAFLFSTDFRPVQINVLSEQTNSHIIAVHTEDGKSTAETICIQGVAKECKSGNSQAGVISVKSLCGSSSVCMKLLEWPSGTVTNYALVAGFNNGVVPDPIFLTSLFFPEVAPASSDQYDKLRLAGADIDYLPKSQAGFQQYQPQAPDPTAPDRQVKIVLAQSIIDTLNTPVVKRAVPDDKRKAVQALARRAVSAFQASNDAEGNALLRQAEIANKQLLSTANIGGTRP